MITKLEVVHTPDIIRMFSKLVIFAVILFTAAAAYELEEFEEDEADPRLFFGNVTAGKTKDYFIEVTVNKKYSNIQQCAHICSCKTF